MAKAKVTNALDGENIRAAEQDDELKGLRTDEHGRMLFWARRSFGYGDDMLIRGQIVAMAGMRNDRKLNRQGFITPLLPTDQVFPCRHCRAQFVDLNSLNAHGERAHSDKDRRPSLPDSQRGLTVDETAGESQQFERDQRVADQVAPLNYDKTEANRGARA